MFGYLRLLFIYVIVHMIFLLFRPTIIVYSFCTVAMNFDDLFL